MSRLRNAFTLVELLVAIAIIAVLIAMLIPAAQRVRESASRTQCINHLKQIGLAIHAHYEALGFFPTGGTIPGAQVLRTSGMPNDGRTQSAGWGFQILPYLDKADLWRSANPYSGPVATYNCPSRRGITKFNFIGTDVYLGDYGGVTPADYGGDPYNGFWRSSIWTVPENVRYPSIIARTSTIGAPVKARQVVDGYSNTLLISEKRLWIPLYEGGCWHDANGWADGWDGDTMRNAAPAPDIAATDVMSGLELGSSHPEGVNGLFADGSVRTIRFYIDQALFDQLANREDGAATQSFEP